MNYGVSCPSSSRLICSLVTCFVLLGCWSAAGGNTQAAGMTQVARLGRPFKLRLGQQVTLKGERLRIKFTALKADSRCPSDVTCVWAGNAAVLLDASTSRRDSNSLVLNTNMSSSFPGEMQYHDYKLRLLRLNPYPSSKQKIAPGDYTVTLLVSKEPATSKVIASEHSAKAPDTEKLILQLEKEGREATLKNDLEANDRLLANNWININPDGSVTTKAQLLELIEAGSFKIALIENDEVLVRVYGKMAVVTGRSTTTRAGQGSEIISRQVRFTRVYDGSSGRWLVVSAHNTFIKQP
jgi:ketosteroid isomerase-like protein